MSKVDMIIQKRKDARAEAKVAMISSGRNPYRNQKQLVQVYKDETDALLDATRDGNEDAKNELLIDLQPLVKRNANYYRNAVETGKCDYQDLVQAGNVGVLKSISKFKAEKGVHFSSFIGWRIRREIKFLLRDCDLIIKPFQEYRMAEAVQRASTLLETATGENPTPSDIIDFMKNDSQFSGVLNQASKLDETQVLRLLNVKASLEIDRNFGSDDSETDKLEWRSDDETLDETNFGMSIDTNADDLWKRQLCDLILNTQYVSSLEKEILTRHFGLKGTPETFKEIAENKVILNGKNAGKPMTAQHVRSYMQGCLKRLQKNMASMSFLSEI